MEKEISVIIPCYNVEQYISRCIESIIKQDIGLDCLDIICVDDCSTDRTVFYLKQYKEKYPNTIRIFHTTKNAKQGTARNIGLKEAKGRYISFVDADDWIEPLMLSHMCERMNEYDVDFVYCKSTRDKTFGYHGNVKQNAIKDSLLYIDNDIERAKAIASNIVGYAVWDKLIKKEFLLEYDIWFPENLAYEDIYWGSLLYLYAKKIYFLEENLYHYFVNDTSTVLQLDQLYHLDIIQINQMKQKIYEAFQGDENIKQALMFDLLYTYYFGTLKVLFLRFTNVPYDVFNDFFAECKTIFGSIKENPFVDNSATAMQKEMINLLSYELTKDEIDQLALLVRTNGI